jgi:hypothetical protein
MTASNNTPVPKPDRRGPPSLRVRDLICCVSLANLLCFGIWQTLLNPGRAELYFLESRPHWSFYVGGVAVFLVLSGLFFELARYSRGAVGQLHFLARLVFLVAAALAANALRHGVPSLSWDALTARLGFGAWFLVVVAVGGAGLVLWRAPRLVGRLVVGGVLALSPFALVTTYRGLEAAAHSALGAPGELADQPLAPTLPGLAPRRVVVLVLDDMGEGEAFAERVPGLRLPALDLLRRDAVVATRAYPPANSTWASIPALTEGRPVSDVRWVGPAELLLHHRDGTSDSMWGSQPNVFARVRGMGGNTGLAGWAHPYCRVLASDLSACSWGAYVPAPGSSLRENVLTHLTLLAETIPGVARLDARRRLRVGRAYSTTPRWHLRQYFAIHQHALRLVRDPRFALVFLHYPVPHGPFIYDQQSGSYRPDGGGTYEGNLVLADRALADLRRGLELTHLDDRTTLIVTADHWRRARGGMQGPYLGSPQHRVPFFVHLPRQAEGLRFDSILRTIVLHDLVLAILGGEIGDAQTVTTWLARHAVRD